MKTVTPIIGIAVLTAAAVFVFIYESRNSPTRSPANAESVIEAPSIAAPKNSSAPDTPIAPLASPVDGAAMSKANQGAPGLADLVGRIELKVKAEPANVGNRILLAQTYGELGRLDDGIAELRKLYTEKLDTGRVDMVLASLLIKNASPPALTEAGPLLDKALKRDTTQAGFVQLYKGRLLVAQGKGDAAVKFWGDALKKLPAGDGARMQIEDELSKNK